MSCPFCEPEIDRVIYCDQDIYCLWDGYPVAEGHALVVPRVHVAHWFDADEGLQGALMAGVQQARAVIEEKYRPDGYNIGINVGAAAGQTVMHLHLHVIPRYDGDVSDPRGGVRHVIPGRGNYLAEESAPAVVRDVRPTASPVVSGIDLPFQKPLSADLESAKGFDLAVAFITQRGIETLEPVLLDLLDRGGRIRLLTGNYLEVTEPRALHLLHDWMERDETDLGVRVFVTEPQLGFHPKAYLVRRRNDTASVHVGSSNLTRHALTGGIEWNQRFEGPLHDPAIAAACAEFERLYAHPNTVALTADWIRDYEKRWTRPAIPPTPPEPPTDVPEPHPIQQDALAALEQTRERGNRAGLVVMATGLGKTWLSAFDSLGFQRILFVAHREEILNQARRTFRRIRPDATFGYYGGGQYDEDADVLFASIQTLARANHLRRFPRDRFDYVVVDEFHHAAARSYRRLIDYFEPQFLLGLTATPERTDGGDLLALCGENLVFRCDLFEGIHADLLSPFQYYGVPDLVEFDQIPWRNGRFDPNAIENAVTTQARADNALEQWREFGRSRTLAFCVSQRHADFMAEHFGAAGIRAVAVHSGPESASRSRSLERLQRGELDVVFAVDMFNEGVDVPAIDTVFMLRPTESKILWLQQVGRGLRKFTDKAALTVIDYIGNHRSFLQVPMLLLTGGSNRPGEIRDALNLLEKGEIELPPGCAITYDLEAIDILRQLAQPARGIEQMIEWYRTFRDLHAHRPSASEAYHEGYDPKQVRSGFGSWLGFVAQQGDLSEAEKQSLEAFQPFLESLDITPMTRSFKMVLLLAMIAEEAFPGRISIENLVAAVRHQVGRREILRDDFAVDLDDDAALRTYLEKNPIAAWAGGAGTDGKACFYYLDGVFAFAEDVAAALTDPLRILAQEICDWRLAQYIDRRLGVHLQPDQAKGPQLWHAYARADIPPLWGMKFSTGNWNQGVVRGGNVIFLLVSLEKGGLAEEHRYEDKFLSPSELQWISQNNTRRDSPTGRRYAEHQQNGVTVELFVRRHRKTPRGTAAPFYYCGPVEFIDWEGDQPIAVRWKLKEPLPNSLADLFLQTN